jgi:leucyl-tRNA synthetase
MSKSKGNVINPDSIVERVGADALRLYEMFMGPFAEPITWSDDGVVGTRRFLERVWNFANRTDIKKADEKISQDDISRISSALEAITHETIKKVSEDIEAMKFNTAVSALMMFLNALEKEPSDGNAFAILLRLLSPFAPHITEELWNKLGNTQSIHSVAWPTYDPKKASTQKAQVAVQVQGKVRALFVPSDPQNETVIREEAESLPEVLKWTAGKIIKKVIVIKNKVVSIVLAP